MFVYTTPMIIMFLCYPSVHNYTEQLQRTCYLSIIYVHIS